MGSFIFFLVKLDVFIFLESLRVRIIFDFFYLENDIGIRIFLGLFWVFFFWIYFSFIFVFIVVFWRFSDVVFFELVFVEGKCGCIFVLESFFGFYFFL